MKIEILLNSGKKIVARMKKLGETSAMLLRPHFRYYVTLEVDGKKNGFTFHDSYANWCSHARMTEELIYEAIDCHLDDCYAYENNQKFWEFATEFGYGDEDTGVAKRAFKGCMRANEGLRDLLSWSEIEELNECIEEWKELRLLADGR